MYNERIVVIRPLVLVIGLSLAATTACKTPARRSRDTAGDPRCPATATQAYAYCGMPDEVSANAAEDQCVPWPNRPPSLWMAFCCPVPVEEVGTGICTTK